MKTLISAAVLAVSILTATMVTASAAESSLNGYPQWAQNAFDRGNQ